MCYLYGVSLANGVIAFGVNNGSSGEGICSTTNLDDSQWHHVAVTVCANATISYPDVILWVDGQENG